MGIPTYGKVIVYGHRYNKMIFDSPVVVQEKVDGSQFSFGILDGELQCRSRGQMIDVHGPDKMFERAVTYVKSVEHLIRPGYIYRGEYLQKPKHNTLAYNNIPVNHIVIFDIEQEPYEYIADQDQLRELAIEVGLEFVPVLYQGNVNSIEQVMCFLENESFLGGPLVEGVVIKNYSIATETGSLCTAKIVSEDFKEKHGKEWKKTNPGKKDILEALTETYKTEARWAKAVQHGKEEGWLQGAPEDIGPLMKAVQQDILEEEKEEIKEVLFKWAWSQLSRTLTSGLPEWYKQKLVEEMFE